VPDFDVVVLGGGTAGVLIATGLAEAGRSVALVEAGLVGGESPYLACVPSKSMLASARRGETWEHAVARRDGVTGQLDDNLIAARLAETGVRLMRGTGQVTRPGAVEITPAGGVRPGQGRPDRAARAARAGNPARADKPGADDAAQADKPGADDAAQADKPGADKPGADRPGADDAVRTDRPGTDDAPTGGTVLGYGDLVVATGSEPLAPPVEGLSDVPTWTSAEALSSPDLPRHLIVMGAGPAGCELAQIYAAFGSQVTLIEAEPQILPDEAPFTGEILSGALRRTGADLRLGSPAVKAAPLENGLALVLADGTSLEGDRILLATGRRPRLGGLRLDKLGVAPSASGALRVDATCRVLTASGQPAEAAQPVSGAGTGRVWAAGDVTGIAPNTHTARYQASVVIANILGERRAADYRAIPRCVFTTPSVYCVGVTPGQAVTAGIQLHTVGLDLAETARAAVEDDGWGRIELYADTTRGDMLVGAAAVGRYAEEWMGELTLAIRAGLSLRMLADVVHAFPTYGEAIERSLRELAVNAH
jgi:pyruvate/2-oxoglutarate dehydrogenase complex dihydrolipoamide dehydrogenase (E3) component